MDWLKVNSDLITIGGKIRYYRKNRKMTQQDLALAAELEVSTIKRLENNKSRPELATCKLLAQALGIMPEMIYDAYLQFIDSDYANYIKSYRKKHNLTQYQLSKLLNVTPKTIAYWEQNKTFPSIKHYRIIMQLANS
nr:helix-turn-helix transcriptional regulator [uncultured Cellulosilyticum sp.]